MFANKDERLVSVPSGLVVTIHRFGQPLRAAQIIVRIHVVAVRHAKVFIEPVVKRVESVRVAEVPFADNSRCVAGVVQKFGNRDFVRMNAQRRIGIQHAARCWCSIRTPGDGIAESGPHRVAAGQQPDSRRRARRPGRIKIGEAPTFGGHAIQMWGANFGLSVTTQIAVTQIVGQDHNDIWPILGHRGGSANQTANHQKADRETLLTSEY